MRLNELIDIQAGGPGSGCNPRKGRCGRFSKEQKKMLKEKGHMISLKPKGEKLTGTKPTRRNTLNEYQVTQPVGYKGETYYPDATTNYITYNYTVLKGKDVTNMPKDTMHIKQGRGKHRTGRLATQSSIDPEPPNRPHSLKGRFREVMRIPVDAEKRTTIVYDAGMDEEGRGVTMFVHKYRTGPNTGHAVIQENNREGKEITSTHEITFQTGKAARDFMRFRHGIDVRWNKQ